mmetsp:Transcript_10325/g.20626  ORF Transcript_10325/g.20626 Transcript_10325/m.20626 type:complete len:80 (-) Transcript_10325:398-637(-)
MSMVLEVSNATGFMQGSRGGGSVYSRGGLVYSRRSYRSDARSVYSSTSRCWQRPKVTIPAHRTETAQYSMTMKKGKKTN